MTYCPIQASPRLQLTSLPLKELDSILFVIHICTLAVGNLAGVAPLPALEVLPFSVPPVLSMKILNNLFCPVSLFFIFLSDSDIPWIPPLGFLSLPPTYLLAVS